MPVPQILLLQFVQVLYVFLCRVGLLHGLLAELRHICPLRHTHWSEVLSAQGNEEREHDCCRWHSTQSYHRSMGSDLHKLII